jgi:hypothetical protein
MMSKQDQDPLKQQIYERMDLKNTEELLNIWRNENREEWTDTAFEVVKEILLTRLGTLPPQEPDPTTRDIEEPIHNQNKLLRISAWANILSWAILILYGARFLMDMISALHGFQILNKSASFVLLDLTTFIPTFVQLALGLTFFLILQAVSECILLFLDVEENGRQSIKALIHKP